MKTTQNVLVTKKHEKFTNELKNICEKHNITEIIFAGTSENNILGIVCVLKGSADAFINTFMNVTSTRHVDKKQMWKIMDKF